MKSLFILITASLFSNFVFSETPIAEVTKIHGEASQLSPGSKSARIISSGDKLLEDTSILTGPKSFVKLKFIDNSEMNIGPESKIVITSMKSDQPGIIALLKGKIRTQVEKNSSNKENKFFIKTRSAAMGIRGTDFQTIYNPENKITSLLTFNGEVAMAKINETQYRQLEENEVKNEIVRNDDTKDVEIKQIKTNEVNEKNELNKILASKETVFIPAGQNSFSSNSLKKVSLPVKISPVQLNALYKNKDMIENDLAKSNSQDLSNSNNEKLILKSADQKAPLEGAFNSKTGDFAPRSGGVIDLETGIYIAPETDSRLDKKLGVYVSTKSGSIDKETGQYLAPKGLKLDAKNGFVIEGQSNEPKLYALKDDLNKSIVHDVNPQFNNTHSVSQVALNEKFIRDEISVSISSSNQSIQLNENNGSSSNHQYLKVSERPFIFGLEWKMASVSQFRPLVGGVFSNIDFKSDANNENIATTSAKVYSLYIGGMYSLTQNLDLIVKYGSYQEHFLDQSPTTNNFSLYRVVINRVSLGLQSMWLKDSKWPLSLDLEGYVTIDKRLNDLKVNSGFGHNIYLAINHQVKDKHWVNLGYFSNSESLKIQDSISANQLKRKDDGPKLVYTYKY